MLTTAALGSSDASKAFNICCIFGNACLPTDGYHKQQFAQSYK